MLYYWWQQGRIRTQDHWFDLILEMNYTLCVLTPHDRYHLNTMTSSFWFLSSLLNLIFLLHSILLYSILLYSTLFYSILHSSFTNHFFKYSIPSLISSALLRLILIDLFVISSMLTQLVLTTPTLHFKITYFL